ncbi:MAG: hypothetical protein EA376_03160 [Phycisphaeraceae bacterium]|nr:MAG: hypothetical protein EA376_03160 [Phycisphaeraceae bacterium]
MTRRSRQETVNLLAQTPMRDVVRGRLTGRLDWRREIRDAELPERVGALVETVVKRTRLWGLEKVDVARELCAHFRDAMDSGLGAPEAIERYGDPKIAARLIRRAKRRARPPAWQVWRRFCQCAGSALAAVLVIYTWFGVTYWLGSPNPARDYLAEINAAAAATPEDARAWPIHRAALLEIGDLPDGVISSEAPLGAGVSDETAAFLDRHRDSIDAFRRAGLMERMGYIAATSHHPEDVPLFGAIDPVDEYAVDALEGSVISALLPHLASVRRIGQLLGNDARLAHERGDADLAVRSLRAIFGIANQVREHPLLISDLVSISIHAYALNIVSELLHKAPERFEAGQLIELSHEIAGAIPDGFSVRLDGERVTFHDVVQRAYTDDGDGGGRMTRQGLHAMASLQGGESAAETGGIEDIIGPFATALMSRRAAVEEFERVMALLERVVTRPLWEVEASAEWRRLNEWKQEEGLQSLTSLPRLLLPAIDRAGVQGNFLLQMRDGVFVAIALELHQRRHGAWPESLEALTPGLLPRVPPDRFDGAPIRYRLRDGEPVVYSVGANMKDNGGRVHFDQDGNPTNRFTMAWRGSYPGRHDWIPDADWILWPPVFVPISDPPDADVFVDDRDAT